MNVNHGRKRHFANRKKKKHFIFVILNEKKVSIDSDFQFSMHRKSCTIYNVFNNDIEFNMELFIK